MTRITIVLDDNLEKRMRLIQAKTIRTTGKNCSFSNVINLVIEKGLPGVEA